MTDQSQSKDFLTISLVVKDETTDFKVLIPVEYLIQSEVWYDMFTDEHNVYTEPESGKEINVNRPKLEDPNYKQYTKETIELVAQYMKLYHDNDSKVTELPKPFNLDLDVEDNKKINDMDDNDKKNQYRMECIDKKIKELLSDWEYEYITKLSYTSTAANEQLCLIVMFCDQFIIKTLKEFICCIFACKIVAVNNDRNKIREVVCLPPIDYKDELRREEQPDEDKSDDDKEQPDKDKLRCEEQPDKEKHEEQPKEKPTEKPEKQSDEGNEPDGDNE